MDNRQLWLVFHIPALSESDTRFYLRINNQSAARLSPSYRLHFMFEFWLHFCSTVKTCQSRTLLCIVNEKVRLHSSRQVHERKF